MIGAILAKKLAGSGLDALSRHDLPKFMKSWAENSTMTYSGNSSMSWKWEGKNAIEDWYAKLMEQFPKIEFTIKEIFVSNIFALGPTNNIAIEWDGTFTNREGKEFHTSGVTTVRAKRGRVVTGRDYLSNTDIIEEALREA